MRILDINNQEIKNPDMTLGHLVPESVFVQHHEAVEAVEASPEKGHYETIAEYPNGGKEVEWVVDIPAVEAVNAKEAWDEFEEIMRYVEYTEAELDEMKKERNKPTAEERLAAIEAAIFELAEVMANG